MPLFGGLHTFSTLCDILPGGRPTQNGRWSLAIECRLNASGINVNIFSPPPSVQAGPGPDVDKDDTDGGGSEDDEDPSINCTICLEVLAERGEHRPAALRCGHIFGEECIKKWLKQKCICPQCNKK